MIDLNNNLSVCSDCINTDICIIYKTYGNIIDISRCKKKIEKNKHMPINTPISRTPIDVYSKFSTTGVTPPNTIQPTITCQSYDNISDSINNNRISKAELRADAIAKIKAIANKQQEEKENKICICEQCHEERKPNEMVQCNKCGKNLCFNCANEDIVSGKYFCDDCYHEV